MNGCLLVYEFRLNASIHCVDFLPLMIGYRDTISWNAVSILLTLNLITVPISNSVGSSRLS